MVTTVTLGLVEKSFEFQGTVKFPSSHCKALATPAAVEVWHGASHRQAQRTTDCQDCHHPCFFDSTYCCWIVESKFTRNSLMNGSGKSGWLSYLASSSSRWPSRLRVATPSGFWTRGYASKPCNREMDDKPSNLGYSTISSDIFTYILGRWLRLNVPASFHGYSDNRLLQPPSRNLRIKQWQETSILDPILLLAKHARTCMSKSPMFGASWTISQAV